MSFRYQLVTAAGEDAGEATYAAPVFAGDRIGLAGNRWATVLRVVPVERVGEFVEEPECGLLEIAVE